MNKEAWQGREMSTNTLRSTHIEQWLELPDPDKSVFGDLVGKHLVTLRNARTLLVGSSALDELFHECDVPTEFPKRFDLAKEESHLDSVECRSRVGERLKRSDVLEDHIADIFGVPVSQLQQRTSSPWIR